MRPVPASTSRIARDGFKGLATPGLDPIQRQQERRANFEGAQRLTIDREVMFRKRGRRKQGSTHEGAIPAAESTQPAPALLITLADLFQ
jgi:hypothetical protein